MCFALVQADRVKVGRYAKVIVSRNHFISDIGKYFTRALQQSRPSILGRNGHSIRTLVSRKSWEFGHKERKEKTFLDY
jgi:hypothetical protein